MMLMQRCTAWHNPLPQSFPKMIQAIKAVQAVCVHFTATRVDDNNVSVQRQSQCCDTVASSQVLFCSIWEAH